MSNCTVLVLLKKKIGTIYALKCKQVKDTGSEVNIRYENFNFIFSSKTSMKSRKTL